MKFKARDKYFDLSTKPLIMGILNITPDSFSDGGKFYDPDKAILQCEKMIAEGADIIDIGGESSRPGSEPVSREEELDRIMSILRPLRERFNVCISVDTYKPEVAKAALGEGADMINDIFGTENDRDLFKTAASYSAGLCIMHIKGSPLNMQSTTDYGDIITEIKNSLESSTASALECGVSSDSIVIDPGIGFGKDIEGNLKILNNLDRFAEIGRPLLIGTSRKSFIGMISGSDTSDRLSGTIASNIIALIKGASIFRVHDIKENKQAIELACRILNT
ncbi:TPA: dihydropteroate synthase [Candidatus Delongbacteria bacterium]|nr:MAG: dihydropteroate synthase [Candidatus Delongbacteria bacterium GWF2_40_14]HAQ62430.1 dihydropteroate synthase [Candidatus Delongbacteria bacterium]